MARDGDEGTASGHLGDDRLRALARAELSTEATAETLRHLAGCAACRRRLAGISPASAELVDELWGAPQEAATWAGDPFDPEVLRAAAESLPLLEDLLTERPERWPLLLNRQRLHSPYLAFGLLQETRTAWQEDPVRARHLVDAAIFLLDRLTDDSWTAAQLADLSARAWGYRANTCRIEGDLKTAEAALAEALRHLAAGTGDPLLKAELHECEAVLHREHRRFEDAARSFGRAGKIYRRANLPLEEARVAVSWASLKEETGDPAAAIELLEEILPFVRLSRGTQALYSIGLQILAVSYVRSGRPAEARRLLPEIWSYVQRGIEGLTLLRVVWLEALVHEGEGRESAERLYRRVQEGFLAARIPTDAALVSLDLAALLLRRGKTAAAAELAADVVPIFEQLEVEREAMMSLRLLLEALRNEAATVEAIQEAAQTLRRSLVG